MLNQLDPIMKGLKFFIPLLILCVNSTHAQSDSLKNEFQFHLVPLFANYGNEFSVQFGYARKFPNNHYLRTGVHVIPALRQRFTKYGGLNEYNKPNYWSPGDPLVINDQTAIGEYHSSTFRTSVYVGYEHLFGKGTTKFLLGVDMLLGVGYHTGDYDVKYYDATYVADTVAMEYRPSTLAYQYTHSSQVDVPFFYAGLSPRIGIRADVSRRIALSIVYAPQFIIDSNSSYYGIQVNMASFNTLGAPFSLDVGLHVKL